MIDRGKPGDYAVAVVTMQMACEIITETVISRLMKDKGYELLEESVAGLFPSYNLGNDRVRKVYLALSGDEIQKEPFWQGYKKLVETRNHAVHRGESVNKQIAEECFEAAKAFVGHLEKRK